MNYTNRYADQQFLYIAQPGKRLLGVIGGVDESTVQIEKKANNTFTLSFTVYETFNGEKSAWYDYLDELMEIYIDGIWFIIKNPPEVNHDGKIESKSIEAQSYEIELQNYDIQRFKVGQGTESSYEMMFQSKYPKEKYPDKYREKYQEKQDDGTFVEKYKDILPTVKFHNPDEPELSLLHILLHHAGLIPSKKVIDENGNEIDNWVDNIIDSPWQIGEIDNQLRYEDSSGQKLPEPILLSNESYAFNIDNSDLYSVLTQDISNAFSCIFIFDTVNCKINAYYVDHLGKDTNVYIGWRNVQNTLKATRKDELFTSVTVSGGDGIDNIVLANFGETDLEDYSYLLEDERYIPITLKEKYKAWVEYRESKRLDYVNLQKKYAESQDVATEIKARVPVDGVTEDWASKSVKDLMQAYDDYTAMLRGYESKYLNENGDFDLDALKKSADWDKYEQIVNYILPTIINKLVSTDDEDAKDIQESLKDYGTGNILKNATFITSSNWIGIDNSLSECNILDNPPVYGATRYMSIHGNSDSCGIKQKELDTSKGSFYTLSAFIRSSNTTKIKLGYCLSNDNNDYSKVDYIEKTITSTWTRVQITFTAPSDITEVYFLCEGENVSFDITAPMLELGINASTFQYFQMDEEYQKSYLTDWKLYGVDELTICQKKYSDQMNVLNKYSQEYDESITDKTEEVYNSYHQLYLDYKKLYDDCTTALTERQKEYDDVIAERDGYKKEYDEIASNVKRENFGNVQTTYPPFTKYEEFLLKKLYKHTDYQNENIISTTITTSVEKVEKEYQLYLDAVDRLYAASHPQYTWEDTLDNVYGLEEFKCLIEPLDIYNFIHVEVNTDGTFERLRVTGITYNPCIYQGDFTLTFSSMTRYKTRRNDFSDLLSSALSAQKNSLTLSAGNSKDVTSYTITPEFIKSLLGNSSFNAYITKNNESTISGVTGNFTNLYSKYITADQITAQLIKADSGEFKKLVSESIQTDILTTKILNADSGFFDSLSTKVLDASQANIEDLIAKKVTADYISTKLISGENGDFIDFVNSHLNFKTITTELLTGATGDTFIDFVHDKMKTGTIEAKQIQGENGETFIDLVNSSMDINKISTKLITGGDGNTFIDFLKNEISTSTITADQIQGKDGKTFIDLVNSSINIKQISTDLVSGGDGNTFIDFLENKIQASEIKADKIVGIKDSKTFIDFVNNQIQTSEITVDQIKGGDGETFINFLENKISTSTILADQIKSKDGTSFIDLVDGQIKIAKITVDQISGGEGKTFIDFLNDTISTSQIKANQISGWNDSSTLIDFVNNTIQSSTIKADKITGISDSKTFIDFVNNQIDTSELNTKVANINSLLSGSAGVGDLQTIHLTANNANIDEAVIKDLIAAKISVADLMTHSASAELITLISQDGKPSIAFKGSTQQFYDSNGNVRIQMGQDAKGDFTFSLFDDTGTGVLIDSKTGVHANAIANGLIVNDMIKNGTVSKDKLGFQIVEPNAYGGIDISTIYDGTEKWGAQYTSFKESTTNSLDNLDKKIDDSIPFQLSFTTSVGSDLAYGVNPQTVVTIHLYRDGKEVTNDYQDSNFIWTRVSADNAGDLYWNEKHSKGSKEITLSLSEDVLMGADFNCSFILDGEVLATLNDD